MPPTPSPSKRKPVVRASELAEFAFCHQAWWLRQQGFFPRQREAWYRGQNYHRQHARRVRKLRLLRLAAWSLWVLSLLLLTLALLLRQAS